MKLGASSLTGVTDQRGFDTKEGWRHHGVAHGADLVLQLGVNPEVGPEGVKLPMEAIATQIALKLPVFYTFGEPERLVRTVVFTYHRGSLDAAFWDSWFAGIASPKPLETWGAGCRSLEGLTKRHDTMAFLHALWFAGRAAGDEAGKALAEKADQAARKVMGG